jgi:pSer/pThr/pTyr-binding forkhead associated (FHA) protein
MKASLPAVFLVAAGTGKRTRIPCSRAVVGRTSACDVVLRAADVSKRHCLIIVESDQVVVEDLGSANGTYVNDRPIARAQLQHGDRLRIADYEFLIRLDQP